MARKGDHLTPLGHRSRPHQVSVRLSSEEYKTLSAQAEEWNSRLPAKASAAARMTVARLLRTAGLRRKRPPAVVSVGIAAEALREVKKARADLARLGNLLKTWVQHGDGAFRGKGDVLTIYRPPNRPEQASVRDLLAALEAATTTLNSQAERLAGAQGDDE